MSSGSQFLEELGDAASDFSLLVLHPLDTRPLAHALSGFDVTLPASIAHRTVGISLGAAPLSWGHCPVSRPSLCLLSISFRFRHRSRTFECRYMRTVGAFGLPADAPLRLIPHSPKVPGCPHATALTSGFDATTCLDGVGRTGRPGCRHPAQTRPSLCVAGRTERNRRRVKGLVPSSSGVDVGTNRMLAGDRTQRIPASRAPAHEGPGQACGSEPSPVSR